MARKNSRVRRSNDRGRMLRTINEAAPVAPMRQQPRMALEDIIIPEGKCFRMNKRRGKATFSTEEKARKALRQAQQNRTRMGTGHVEKRVYQCPEGGCGGWHLSSREAFDEKLSQERHDQFMKRIGGES